MIKPKNNNASYMFSHKSYYYICINDYSTFIFSSSFLIFFCLEFFFFFIYFRTININTMIYFTMIIIKLRKYVFYICSVIIIALSVTFSFFFINFGIFFYYNMYCTVFFFITFIHELIKESSML